MTAQQTCDRCGPSVVALVMACLPSGRILTYCRHCANRFRVGLESGGGTLYDLDSAELQATDPPPTT